MTFLPRPKALVLKESAQKISLFPRTQQKMWPRLKPLSVSFDSSKFSNFDEPKSHFKSLLLSTKNSEMKDIYVTRNDEVKNLFRSVFSNIVESRGITNITKDDFDRWSQQDNNVIHIDDAENTWINLDDVQVDSYDFVSVGGPCALIANHWSKINYDSASNSSDSNNLHVVTSRKDSNHDGSAYYYHERDAFPVYVNRVNRGPYCVFIDLWKRIFYKKLNKIIEDDHLGEYVRISMNWSNILKKPRILYTIFMRNFYYMMKNIYLGGKDLNNVVLHSQQTPSVIRTMVDFFKKKGLNTSFEDFLIIDQDKFKACYVNVNPNYDPRKHFQWLSKYAYLPFNILPKEEIISSGFGKNVQDLLHFTNDGCINPMCIDNLKDLCLNNGINELENYKVTNIYYNYNNSDNILLKFENMNNSKLIKYISTSKLVMSLGPSAEYIINGKNNLLNDYMWASGVSCVLLIAIDREKYLNNNNGENLEKKMECFTYYVDSINQHCTLIDSATILNENDNKFYSLFAIQMTGGGNFPSMYQKPDSILSLLYNCERIYDLKNKDKDTIFYDIVQLRGCARAVTASNSICFTKFKNTNISLAYGLGGIGMTTMFPNGVLLSELVENSYNTHKSVLNNIDYSQMLSYL